MPSLRLDWVYEGLKIQKPPKGYLNLLEASYRQLLDFPFHWVVKLSFYADQPRNLLFIYLSKNAASVN
jgi:hypothetical protein